MSNLTDQFENLNLHIEKGNAENTFRVSAIDDAGKVQAQHSFQYYSDPLLLSKLEDSVGKNIPETSALIQNFGQGLYNAVFGGEILGYYKALEKGSKDIRLKLFFKQEEPELLRIPWEFMFDGNDFLSAYPRITMSRVLEGIPTAERGPIEGKIKILAVVSSPLDLKDHERLRPEEEQMLILQALDRPHAENKIEVEFLDEASLRNIQSKLDEEEYHILHYTGHGVYSEREDRGYLLLEDDSGKSRHVDNQTVATLLAGYRSLRLVVLSGCQTAKTSGRHALSDLATPLLQKRIPSVVAMQYSVADRSAIELAQKLYSEIANNIPIDLALTRARKELLLSKGTGMVDFATPVLYANDPACLVTVDVRAKPKDAGVMPPKTVTIKRNVELRIERLGNQFIGRRRQLRRIKEDYFLRGIRVVVLHGIGGIGKTVTAAKVAEQLMDNFDGVFAFECREGLTAEEVLMQLNEFFKRNSIDALDQACTASIPMATKMDYLAQVLSQFKLLLIFDNFESLLSVEKDSREITDVELKKALKVLVNQCKNGTRFLFTCRYTFNLTDGRLTNVFDEINLGELSRPEAIMVMNRFPDIAGEDFSTKLEIYDKIGGHPYTINTFGRHANRTSPQDVLLDLAPVQKDMVEFTLLNRSYDRLSESSRHLVNSISAFKKAVPLSGLEWFMGQNDQPVDIAGEIEELTHWGLMIRIEEESEALFQVHTIVKDYIRTQATEDEWKQRLVKAAEYYENLVQTSRSVLDHLDARELYFDAGQYQKAGDMVAAVMEPLHRRGFIELVRKLNQQTIETAAGRTKAAALHHLGIIHHDQGDYAQAIENYNLSLKINEELGDKSGIAITLHQLGIIHQDQGDYAEAIKNYGKSMKIAEELGDKSGMAQTLHQLGNIFYSQGDYAEAIEKYNQSMKIKEELGNKSGIAKTLHQLGMIHQDQGDYARAIEKYTKCMEMFEELGNKSGIASTLHQLGNIFYAQGDYDQAIDKYNQSMKIKNELGDKSGIAATLGQIGIVHQAKGEFKEALKCYLTSAMLFEHLKSPYLQLAVKYIHSIKEQIGEETFEKYNREITVENEGEGHE